MGSTREENMRQIVREMFEVSNPPAGEDKTDEKGAPLRLKKVASDYFSPDVRIIVPGQGPQAFEGGKEDYFQHHIKRMGGRQDKLTLELLDILLGEKYAAGVVQYRDEVNGKKFSWLRINRFIFNEDATRVIECRVFEHDQHGVDAWYSSYMS